MKEFFPLGNIFFEIEKNIIFDRENVNFYFVFFQKNQGFNLLKFLWLFWIKYENMKIIDFDGGEIWRLLGTSSSILKDSLDENKEI